MRVSGIAVVALILGAFLYLQLYAQFCAQAYAQTQTQSEAQKKLAVPTASSAHSTTRHARTARFTANCSSPQFPSATATPIDSKCGNDGDGGAEKTQNDAKNNFCPLNSTAQSITVGQLADLQQKASAENIPFGNIDGHPLSTSPGPATNRQPLKTLGEGKLVTLEGYVKTATQEGDESVNCGTKFDSLGSAQQPAFHDIHVSLISALGQAECDGIVAEMIPHHRPGAWTADTVNQVSAAKLKVRVTGQLMFDSSHTPCVNGQPVKGADFSDPARISLWEIHPIYKFEVCTKADCTSGGWIDLALWTQ
ncbi:MAG: hypothetical protein WA718_19235 [Terriglobales bacterium]